MIETKSFASFEATQPLRPYNFNRRAIKDTDVHIEIKYAGICHSDIHTVRAEWGQVNYPLVPGHEIVGIVKKVGSKVSRFKAGDVVGVGCMVDSCQNCESCKRDLEQFCPQCVFTYNSIDKDGQETQGGYADNIVVDEKFVLNIPKNLPLENTAPLLCAGITTYSPLMHWKINHNHKVGVIGLGGLGHMAVKIACALGAHVIVFTRSLDKKEDALKLGAKEVVISKNKDEMENQKGQLDFILDTVSAPHDLPAYLALLKIDGTLCMVGASPEPHNVPSTALIFGRKNVSGSLIGGIAETQEMLDFCGKHNITSDIELIPIQQVNEAYERVMRSDVKYRFVIDIKTLHENAS